MAILRIQKKCKNFLILEKTCLEDSQLSWKAKGLHTYLIGLPDDWKISIPELITHSSDGRDATKAAVRELIEAGYITQSQSRGKDGRFGRGDYLVHELPQRGTEAEARIGQNSVQSESSLELGDFALEPESVDKGEALEIESAPLCPKPLVFDIPQVSLSFTPNPRTDFPTSENSHLLSININNNYLNKTTAEEIVNIPERDFAAGKKINNANDLIIAKTLSSIQQDIVHEFANTLISQKIFSGDLPTLEATLSAILLDTRSFSQAGNDFFKKLNTLKKCIREGKWTPPIQPEKAKVKSEVSPQMKHEQRYRELFQDLEHWKGLLMDAIRDGKGGLQASMSKVVADCEQKLAVFLQNSGCSHGAAALH